MSGVPASLDPMRLVRAELDRALARISERWLALPAMVRDEVVFQDRDLEAEIDLALLAEDPIRTLRAIRAWENFWTVRLAYSPLDRNDEIVTQIVNRDPSPIPPRGKR